MDSPSTVVWSPVRKQIASWVIDVLWTDSGVVVATGGVYMTQRSSHSDNGFFLGAVHMNLRRALLASRSMLLFKTVMPPCSLLYGRRTLLINIVIIILI